MHGSRISYALLSLLIGLASETLALADEWKGLQVGDKVPEISLRGIDKQNYSLWKPRDGDLLVLFFTTNRDPIAAKYDVRINEFAKVYGNKGVQVFGVNPLAEDGGKGITEMRWWANKCELKYPYLHDEGAKAAKAFGATRTPEVFVIEGGKVVYKGAFDDHPSKPTKSYVADAVQAVLAGKSPEITETRPFGGFIDK